MRTSLQLQINTTPFIFDSRRNVLEVTNTGIPFRFPFMPVGCSLQPTSRLEIMILDVEEFCLRTAR